MNLAVITGADGGMGMEITRAVATAGYQVIMACRDPQAAEPKRQLLMRETGNPRIETAPIDLASLASVAAFGMEMSNRINEQKPMRKRNIPGMASPMTRMCQADGLAYVSISVTV